MMGDTENSVKHLQSAMRSDPDNTSVRAFYRKVREIEEKREAGNAAFKRGAHEDAIANWSAAIDLDKSNKSVTSKLYNNRATALSKLKRYEDAVQDCNRAIAGNASYAKAYLRRAECQFAIGTPESLQKCIR
jgi:DnaJ family protein C protein 7